MSPFLFFFSGEKILYFYFLYLIFAEFLKIILLVSGDEIEPPDGDDYDAYRILFDITFFFFVIVILLAIIQGKRVCWWKWFFKGKLLFTFTYFQSIFLPLINLLCFCCFCCSWFVLFIIIIILRVLLYMY